jgi:hypothetical protein
MGSNHRLVLFTHALCQLSYPAVDRSVASRSSGTPGGPSLACAPMRRKQITTRQQRPSRHTVSSKESSLGVVRIAPSRVVRGCYRRSRARRAANQGRPPEDKMEEKFTVVWTIDGETMSIPHSTQDEALHQAEKLLRKYGCGLEITLHLDDEISAPPAIWFNKKRMQQWCLAGFPAVRI